MTRFEDISENIKGIGDALSIGIVVGTIADMLPSIAAILTIVWTAIRIWETPTIQRIFRRNGDGT